MKHFLIEKKQLDYLSKRDPVLAQLIEHIPPMIREVEENSFIALVSSIVYQQISTAAGNAIWGRFTLLVSPLTPENTLKSSIDLLRTCGLSGSKSAYIHAIAKAFDQGVLTEDFLKSATNSEIIHTLTQIKGIGTWTAEMYLMFGLGRTDVFSYKDLGLRNGIQWLYGLKEAPTEAFVDLLVRLWQPYATIAAFYLWEITIQKLSKEDRQQTLGPVPFDIYKEGLGYLHTPIGLVEIKTDQHALTHITFVHSEGNTNETPLVCLAKEELIAYFEGHLKKFTLPLSQKGTLFQQKVYEGLLSIPYAQTRGYGDLAKAIGNEKSSRAVGNANNKNPLPIIVPCHRVIGAKGQLVGYAGGLDKKAWLLAHEKKWSESVE